MRKAILWTAGVIVTLVVIVVVVVALQPTDFYIARSTKINAPPEAVFAQVNDLRKWDDWSPWAKLDPNSKATFSGPTSGKDSKFAWSSDHPEVGVGSMTIIESKPGELVTIRLEFEKPFEGTSEADFSFKPEGDATEVTWAMRGKNNFIGKAMCLVMNMDKMMGEKFDEGLASMKKTVESQPKSETHETPAEATAKTTAEEG